MRDRIRRPSILPSISRRSTMVKRILFAAAATIVLAAQPATAFVPWYYYANGKYCSQAFYQEGEHGWMSVYGSYDWPQDEVAHYFAGDESVQQTLLDLCVAWADEENNEN
jgi:hypothetical protein